MTFAESVAVVTGGTRGIGRAIVLELVAGGARVAFTYQSNVAAAETLEREAKELGGEVVGYQQDVADFQGTKAVLQQVLARFSRIDMLVNNAGITRDSLLAMMKEDDWRKVIETNLYGTINFS